MDQHNMDAASRQQQKMMELELDSPVKKNLTLPGIIFSLLMLIMVIVGVVLKRIGDIHCADVYDHCAKARALQCHCSINPPPEHRIEYGKTNFDIIATCPKNVYHATHIRGSAYLKNYMTCFVSPTDTTFVFTDNFCTFDCRDDRDLAGFYMIVYGSLFLFLGVIFVIIRMKPSVGR